MKGKFSLALMLAAVVLLVFSVPVQASKTDDQIVSSAKNSYVFKNYLKNDDIKIQSKDGAVTLTGTVSEESHKTLARETVAGLSGVKTVDNRLEVKGAPLAATNSDAWLITKVKTTLLFHSSVSASATEVNAKDGIVTLRGDAASQAQKDLTTEYAKDIDGVKDVKNIVYVFNPFDILGVFGRQFPLCLTGSIASQGHDCDRRFACQSSDQSENAKYNEIEGNDVIQ